MSLSTAAKDYIASHFGAGTPKCFVSSGISYTDPAGTKQTGSTKDVVATLKMNIGGSARGPGGEVYIDIPNWSSINDADVVAIGTMTYCVGTAPPPTVCTAGTKRCKDSRTIEQCRSDGTGWTVIQTCGTGYECKVVSGVAKCVSVGTTPPPSDCPWDLNGNGVVDDADKTIFQAAYGSKIGDSNWNPACDFNGNGEVDSFDFTEFGSHFGETCPGVTPPPSTGDTVGPFEFTFGETCTGNPTATIDVTGLGMWQETDTFRMNKFMVKNTSACVAYFATQLKLWPLSGSVPTTCPTYNPEWSGMDRSTWEAGNAYIEVVTLSPGETKEVWMDFFVPSSVKGRKTLCMYLWANFSKYALYDELEVIGET